MQVDAWLPRAAAAHPGRPAVNDLTYSQLLTAARATAGRLTAAGAGRASRVAIVLPPGEDFAIALHACLLLGAAAVPVDVRLTGAERERQIAGCAAILDSPPPREGCDSPAPATKTHDLDAVAAVVHTSGSTAEPRPIELTYGNWLWSAIGSGVALGSDPEERWLSALPVSHVGGLSVLMRSAIAGTTAVLHERFDPGPALEELMAHGGATVVSVVPTTLERLLDAGLARPPRLRWALLGGAPLPAALLDRARAAGVPVAPTYGLTEACSQVATLGAPLFCTRVRIAADGEIEVRSPTVSPGSAGPDGWLRTGDLGALDPDGALTVTGRKADTIVSGGENVAPAEVEAALGEHPAVAEALVHGRPDPEFGEVVVALVVLKPGGVAAEKDLREFCAARLAPFKVPKAVMFAEALPRTASGKLIRRPPQRFARSTVLQEG